LGGVLKQEKKLSEDWAWNYLAEIILAMAELHWRDIIFRDLKPDNVVIDEDGHAMLTDFGLSKEGITGNEEAKSFCGSVAYLAPEILKRQGHGKSVDWYLCGVLLYEMLVGIPPYFDNKKEQMFKNIKQGPLKMPDWLSIEVKDLLTQLLKWDPTKWLGAGKTDAEEIKTHAWFKDINWEHVYQWKLVHPKPAKKEIKVTWAALSLEEKAYGAYANIG